MRVFGLVAVAVILVALGVSSVHAHTTLRNHIQHRTTVTVGPRNTDVGIELTFHEDCSIQERRRMDDNKDGRITTSEAEAYVAREAERFRRAVKLSLNGKPVEPIPLFDPRVDLCGNDATVPHFHVLRLDYFVRTPKLSGSGVVLEVKDGLWPEEHALRSVEVIGKDGVGAGLLPSEDQTILRVRCRAPEGPRPEP